MSQCQAGAASSSSSSSPSSSPPPPASSSSTSSCVSLPCDETSRQTSHLYPSESRKFESQCSRSSMSSESSDCSRKPLVSSGNKCASKYMLDEQSYSPLTTSTEKLKSVSSKLLCASCAAFFTSSLPSGFNLGVINTPQEILKNFCNESLIHSGYDLSTDQLDLLWSGVVSIFLIGAMIGSAMNAWASNRLGRKMTIILSSLLALTAAVLFILSKFVDSVLLIILGRFLSGIHCGLASCLVPMYLIEISPRDLREAIGILHCFGLTMGILIAQVLGQEGILGTHQLWPYLLAFYSTFIGLGFLMMINSPESPVYLFMDCNEESKALEVLEQVYGDDRPQDVLNDFYEMQNEKKLRQKEASWTMWSTITCSSLRRQLFLVCVLHIGQQFSGINAVFYYSTAMFESVGFNDAQSQIGSILVASVNVIVSIIAIPVVNSISKRTLMTFSSIASALFLIALTASNYYLPFIPEFGLASIVFVMCYVFVYGFGLGPIPYTIGSDLFDSGPRPFGMSLGCLCNWTCNFIIAMTFTILDKIFGYYTYLLFAASCIIIALISILYLGDSKDLELIRNQSSARDLGVFNRNISNVSDLCRREASTARMTRVNSVSSSIIEF